MDYGAPDRAIQVAKTVVCGTLGKNPNTSNADLTAKVASATNWPPLNAAYFTGAAIQAYCPQYGSLACNHAPARPQPGAVAPPEAVNSVDVTPGHLDGEPAGRAHGYMIAPGEVSDTGSVRSASPPSTFRSLPWPTPMPRRSERREVTGSASTSRPI
nr:DUF732 domain-containing protein [Mycobacterium numidiamassiliense]